jgi:hypothetical protein
MIWNFESWAVWLYFCHALVNPVTCSIVLCLIGSLLCQKSDVNYYSHFFSMLCYVWQLTCILYSRKSIIEALITLERDSLHWVWCSWQYARKHWTNMELCCKKNSFVCGWKLLVRNRLASSNADKAETAFDIEFTPRSDKI